MTDRDTLLALATLCEDATWPDRALDAAITVALTEGATGVERPPLDGLTDEPQAGWLLTFDTPRPWTERWVCVPAYTASLDAALTLVPEGAGIKLDRHWTPRHEGPVWMAVLYTGLGEMHVSEDRPTPALALCAAALLARAAGDAD